jgi:hypothetical protein
MFMPEFKRILVRFITASTLLVSLASCGAPIMRSIEPQGEATNSDVAGNQVSLVTSPIAGPLYTRALTENDIIRLFGVTKATPVTRTIFEAMLRDKMKVIASDATTAARAFLDVSSASFIPEPQVLADLEAEGLPKGNITDGLLPSEYLMYLRVAHGEGRCPGVKAGSPQCPARVRDLQMSVITNQNLIINIRSTQTANSQYRNTFTLHRESEANRRVIEFFGRQLGFAGNPLKQAVIDPAIPQDCTLLESMLGSSKNLEAFLAQTVKVQPVVAAVTARQWLEVVSEETLGVIYSYGVTPFLYGRVASRSNLGSTYAADPQMTARLEQLLPNFASKSSLNCREVAQVVNVLASVPDAGVLDFTKPVPLPFDKASPQLTADELFDIFVALGNGLVNQPAAPFADTLPLADLALLDNSGVYNPENQMTVMTHRYFLELFVGR